MFRVNAGTDLTDLMKWLDSKKDAKEIVLDLAGDLDLSRGGEGEKREMSPLHLQAPAAFRRRVGDANSDTAKG